jgi:hypothetical protein
MFGCRKKGRRNEEKMRTDGRENPEPAWGGFQRTQRRPVSLRGVICPAVGRQRVSLFSGTWGVGFRVGYFLRLSFLRRSW